MVDSHHAEERKAGHNQQPQRRPEAPLALSFSLERLAPHESALHSHQLRVRMVGTELNGLGRVRSVLSEYDRCS